MSEDVSEGTYQKQIESERARTHGSEMGGWRSGPPQQPHATSGRENFLSFIFSLA